MFDLQHFIEVAAGNIFVAGVAYGVLKTKLGALDKRMDSADTARDGMSKRIDDIYALLTKR